MSLKKKVYRTLSAAAVTVLSVPSAWADYQLNFQKSVTDIGDEVYNLHMLIFYICAVIGAVVFAVMFYSMWAHRKSRGAVAAQFHENTKLEVIWTILPFVILISMAIPSTGTLLDMEDASNPEMTIKVTGKQWKWIYEYDADGTPVKFVSSLHPDHDAARKPNSGKDVTKIKNYLLEVDNEMVIPTNTRVRFRITSDDVIHAWWVPAFAVKKDAIPGIVNEAWTKVREEGTYRGQCAELCGRDHAFMPIVVSAVKREKFDTWLAQKKAEADKAAQEAASDKVFTKEELIARGQKIYVGKGGCFGCHGMNGEGVGAFPPLKGSALANGPAAEHIQIVKKGKAGTAMSGYASILNPVEMAAVITYERQSWGNTGSVVQPADVKAAP